MSGDLRAGQITKLRRLTCTQNLPVHYNFADCNVQVALAVGRQSPLRRLICVDQAAEDKSILIYR